MLPWDVPELKGVWCNITNFQVAVLAANAACSHCPWMDVLVVPSGSLQSLQAGLACNGGLSLLGEDTLG